MWGVKSAFTIVELLIVLVIMAGFAALAIPRLTKVFGRSQLQLAAQQLAEDLSSARLFAIEQGLTYDVMRMPEGRYVVVPQAMSGQYIGAASALAASDTTNGAADGTSDLLGSKSAQEEVVDKVPRLDGQSGGVSGATGGLGGASSGATVIQKQRPPDTIDGELGVGIRFAEGSLIALGGDEEFSINQNSQLGRRLGEKLRATAEDESSTTALGLSQPKRMARFYADGRADADEVYLESDDGYRIQLSIRRLTGGVTVNPIERVPEPEDALETDPLDEPSGKAGVR